MFRPVATVKLTRPFPIDAPLFVLLLDVRTDTDYPSFYEKVAFSNFPITILSVTTFVSTFLPNSMVFRVCLLTAAFYGHPYLYLPVLEQPLLPPLPGLL